jgi:tetratricopeptide (TPR) repeat protein
MRGKARVRNRLPRFPEVNMYRPRIPAGLLLLFAVLAPASQAQLGKSVMIPAGSEADHQLTAINGATDATEKLKLIEQFAEANPEGDLAIVADEQYVNYYINEKQYDKAFVYGDKLFAIDPDNYANAVNMVRAANEKGNSERVFAYGEKATAILNRYKTAAPPAGASPEDWQKDRAQKLDSLKDNQDYVEQSMLSAAFQQKDPAKKADLLVRYSKIFPDSPNSEQALSMAAFSYQQAQNSAKMIELANGVLAKDPNNIGMLLLLGDYYSEKGEQLDKAEAYAKKAASLCDSAKKPENLTLELWQKQNSLQKGLALSALGQVNIEKKDNASAVKNLTSAAPLLKADATSYARNQYRLGFAYLNLKNMPAAKQAFMDAASLDTPYKGPAQDKLKGLGGATPAAKK